MEDYRSLTISSRNKQNEPDDFPQNSPEATSIDRFPTVCVHARVCDRKMTDYGPDEAAKLDAVLAGVNQLIECLNIEFDDECCSPNHSATIAIQEDSFGDDTSNLIDELKSVSTSGSLPLSQTACVARASKQQSLAKSDTKSRGNYDKEEIESDFHESRDERNENDGFFTEGDVTLKNEIFNKILEGAEISSEMNSLKEKDKPTGLLEKQMTLSQLECPLVFNKELPLPEQTVQLNEQMCKEIAHLNVNGHCNNNYSEAKYCSVEAEKDREELKGTPISSYSTDFDTCLRRKTFKKANSENNPVSFVRDSVDSGTFSIDIDTTSTTATIGEDQEDYIENKGKEKRLLKAVSSLPVKAASYKENQIAAIKAFLPKRKISKSKEPAELKKLQINESNCSCFQLQENGNRKNSSSFALPLPDSANISNQKQSGKNQKSLTRRKTFLPKQKRFGLYFRRSQSFDTKNSVEEVDSDCSSTAEDALELDLDDKGQSKDFSNRESLRKNGKSRLSPSSPPVLTETSNKGTLDRMRFLMNKSSHMSQYKASNIGTRRDCLQTKIPTLNEDSDSVCFEPVRNFPLYNSQDLDQDGKVRYDSSKGTGFTSDCSELVLSEDGVHRRRATLDATPSRPKFLDTRPSTKSLLRGVDASTTYSSLPRKWQQAGGPNGKRPADTGTQAWLQTDSDGSFRGSQDSLDDEESNARHTSHARQRRPGRQYESLTEQNSLDSIAKLATMITKKNKLRKTLKKSTSITIPDADEMAERTWAPTGDCTWGNMSGKRVELGSTHLQSLSELESDALQKVALNHLHDAELGVTIVVPKDESKILNRKISLKKKYGVLSSKDKNKDKNYEHVFGIPLVNVVENDQLLRLQKSASFATPLEYQSPEAADDSAAAVAPDAGSGLSSSTNSSCSGSSSSIHNHQLPQFNSPGEGEDPPLPRSIKKTTSSENLDTKDFVSNSEIPDADNVFNNTSGKENDNPNQAQTPTSAKSSSSTAAQPLRRRGAIAANSINEIDPYQSQLLEALSLSVSGTTTSQRKEKKRSLLPPTMTSVPYVVQKCCDHIKKYGLDITGIFRIAGSKKRVKQLREEFDGGMDVTIDEDYNPHDVAALLKEFFRDLPEALLTRELYPAFIQTAKLLKHERLSCLRYLMWLLPLSNRDTLHTLLNFLAVVAAHSETSVDRSGNKAPGNKMNTSNLAMIFGPNIMHRYKKTQQSSNDNHYQVPSLEKPEESTAVIKIVEDLITNQVQLFQIPKEEHDEMLRVLKESDPEAVDFLLRRKAANYLREKSRLLDNTSLPNNAKSQDQSIENGNTIPAPDFTDPVHCQFEQEDAGVSQISQQNKNDDSPRIYSAMRLSYQQATGHALIPEEEGKREKGTKLKFKRPIFKKPQQPSQPLNEWCEVDERRRSSSSGSEEIVEEVQDSVAMDTNKLVDENLQRRCVPASSSSAAVTTKTRSMSFTDDDLLQILGRKDDKKLKRSSPLVPVIHEFRCGDECCDNTNDQPVMQQAIEAKGEEYEYALSTENKVYFMEDPTVRVTDLSDSDKSADSKNNVVASQDKVKRRGGFSLQPQTKTKSVEPEKAKTNNATVSSSSVRDKTHWHYIERVDYTAPDSINTKNAVIYNDQPTRNGYNTSSTHHVDKDVIEKKAEDHSRKFKSSLNVRVQTPRISIQNNNNNNNCDDSCGCILSGAQSLQLHPLTVSAISAALIPDTQASTDSPDRLKLATENLSVALNEVPPVDGDIRPKPLPRRRLQNSLSPRIQRQYGPPSVSSPIKNLISERATATEKSSSVSVNQMDKDQKIESPELKSTQRQNKERVSHPRGRKRGKREFKAALTPSDENKTTSLETNSPRPHKTNVASLVRRYSKDDLALADHLKQVPGSRWTASGLLGKTDSNLNDSPQRSRRHPPVPANEESSGRPIPNKGHLSWHGMLRDKQHLPETLV